MNRSLDTLDAFSRHLRFLQFTSVVACLTFATVVMSDRQTIIRLANEQINLIYNYTRHWEFENVQLLLDRMGGGKNFVIGSVHLASGQRNYELCLDDTCKDSIRFPLKFHRRILGGPVNDPAEVFRSKLSRPTTLLQFRAFYDGVSEGCCIYSIDGIRGKSLKKYDGYVMIDPSDDGCNSATHDLSNIILRPITAERAERLVEPDAQERERLNANSSENSGVNDRIEFSGDISNTFDGLVDCERRYIDKLEGPRLVIKKSIRGPNLQSYDIYVFPPFVVNKRSYNGVEILGQKAWIYSYYDEQFKALASLTKEWPEIGVDVAKKIINAEYAREDELFEVVGFELSADLLRSWGIFLILGIQFYYYLHIRELNRRKGLFKGISAIEVFPWLALQKGASAIMNYISVVLLPLASLLVLIGIDLTIQPWREVVTQIQVWIAGLVIVVTSFLIGREQIKLRRMMRRVRKDHEVGHDGHLGRED